MTTPQAAPALAAEPEQAKSRKAVEEIFDIYAQLDRLDEEALRKEMEGGSVDELVYEVDARDGGKEFRLSKVGVDECCTQLTNHGQCIREVSVTVTYEGEGEDRIGFFNAIAARYAVAKDGSAEGKLDELFGVKRQPLYDEAGAELSLDVKMGFGKYGKLVWRQVLTTDRNYIEWIANKEGMDERKRQFAQKCLDGEDIIMEGGRRFNPHWYEHGAMKALRNARIRLIPRHVREAVIAMAKEKGKVLKVEQPKAATAATPPKPRGAVRLPGTEDNWGRHGGKPITEVPTSELIKARDYYREKKKNEPLCEKIDLLLDRRREEGPPPAAPQPVPPETFEKPPAALEEDEDDLPF